MSIEAAIHGLVTGDAAVAAVIGDRLVPLSLPQSMELPALTFKMDLKNEDMTTEGALGLIVATFRFDCWAATHAEAVELAAALRTALQDYSGTISGVKIHHVRILNRGDLPGLDVEAEQMSRYGKFLDAEFSWEAL